MTSFNIITTNDKSVLHYKRYNFFDTEINLSEFDSGAQFCPDSIYASPKIANSLVCVIGEAGVHSQKIELFDYLNGKLNKMMFTDKLIKSDTLDSDVPKFSIVDYNNDKLLDVTADFRDYDTDPLKQGIRYFYKNDQNSFIYDKQEKVSY